MDSFQLEQLLQQRQDAGVSWLPFLQHRSLEMGIYVVAEDDHATHTPHTRDEVYYAIQGHGMLRAEGEDQAVSPGSILFVPAHQQHHFHSIQEKLTLLVFFAEAGASPAEPGSGG